MPDAHDLSTRYRFGLALRYELFYALQTLTDPAARIHPGWREGTWSRLPSAFGERFERLGAAPMLWPLLADALGVTALDASYDEIAHALAALPARELQRRVLEGALHQADLVERLLGGEALSAALAKVPRPKQAWLAFIGLYPFDPQSPAARALTSLLVEPEHFRREVLALLGMFWEHAFAADWAALQPALAASLAQRERLAASVSFEELARALLLRIEVDTARHTIKAVRGGYELPFAQVAGLYLSPSAFNDQRYWTVQQDAQGCEHAYFPYFDPAIAVHEARPDPALAAPALDPALIFKALGDTTRYAIATLLARNPTSATDLARTLAVSKPTISHHVALLRTAGLLEEQVAHGHVRLALRRDVLEGLSALVIHHLFHDPAPATVTRTRTR